MKKAFIRSLSLRILGFGAAFVILAALAGVLILHFTPGTGAYGAEVLRKVLGDRTVAVMEMTLFQVQDMAMNAEYHLGLAQPVQSFGSPVGISVASGAKAGNIEQPGSTAQVTPAPGAKLTNLSPAAKPAAPGGVASAGINPDWTLPVISGQNGGSGSDGWQPYLVDGSGRIVAYRALVHPDPSRPYAYTAVVAFDLHSTRLHYVLGRDEPFAPGVKKTASGAIPAADVQSGLLVAAFNGGFKYEHGHFGSMANGFVSAAPRDGMGTLAIYPNGMVKIGEWGKDFQSVADMVAFRQNGPLLIQDGKINQQVDDPNLWGETITGQTVTFRSGIAISPDGRTLYYFAGQYLNASSLASAMAMVQPQAGMQLDINNYWVYFSAFTESGKRRTAAPLLPKAMVGATERFLVPYSRDFFYVTIAP